MNKLKLYHYSNADFKGYIKPDFFGLNNYTSNDKNITTIKRAFYYTRPEPEHLLSSSKFLYITKIEPEVLYNISQDIRGYLKSQSIGKALRRIKRHFKGIIYNIGNIKIVNLFYDIKINKRLTLTR